MRANPQISGSFREKLGAADLQIYKTSWCPDCARLDHFLSSLNLSLGAVDIDLVEGAAERLEAETGKRGVPYVLVNGCKWIRGYHKELPGRFDPELFLSDLEAALG